MEILRKTKIWIGDDYSLFKKVEEKLKTIGCDWSSSFLHVQPKEESCKSLVLFISHDYYLKATKIFNDYNDFKNSGGIWEYYKEVLPEDILNIHS